MKFKDPELPQLNLFRDFVPKENHCSSLLYLNGRYLDYLGICILVSMAPKLPERGV